MRLPEKTAFTLSEVAAQFEVDEETVIDWWWQGLISFCVRWEADYRETFYIDYRYPFEDPRHAKPCQLKPEMLLRLDRFDVRRVLVENKPVDLMGVGLEYLAVREHLKTKLLKGPVSIVVHKNTLCIDRTRLLISRWERDRFRATLESDKTELDPTPGRRERQIQAIMEGVQNLGYEPLKIPRGGKKAVESWLNKNHPGLFTRDSFMKAWQEAPVRYTG